MSPFTWLSSADTSADTLSNSEHYHMVPVPPTTEASPPLRHLSFVPNTAKVYFRTVLCCFLTWSGCVRLSHFNLSFAHWTLLNNAPKIHYTVYTFKVKRSASTLPVFWRFKNLPNKGNVVPLIPGDCASSCFFQWFRPPHRIARVMHAPHTQWPTCPSIGILGFRSASGLISWIFLFV